MVKRIVTAFVAILVGVSFIIIDNIWAWAVAAAFFGTVGTWELIGAVNCRQFKLMTALCLVCSAIVPFVLIFAVTWLIAPVLFVYIAALFGVMLTKHKRIKFEHLAMCGSAAIIIPAAISCVVLFRYSGDSSNRGLGVFLVLYVLFAAWFGDSGAYFVGTFLGKHKLCPEISPKKTVEGFIGGIITVGVVMAITGLIFDFLVFDDIRINYPVVIIVGMIASVFGVLGDLSASIIKRGFGVKDFGNVFPGHGGVLDRFDSVLFVAPFVYLVCQYFSPIIA